MNNDGKKYFIKIKGALVEVTDEIYIAYYEMERKEKYMVEKDKAHGLLYYDSWDTEDTRGIDYIMDSTVNVEEEAIRTVIASDIWSYVAQIDDKYHICEGIAKGTTEINHKNKKKVLNSLKNIIEKNS